MKIRKEKKIAAVERLNPVPQNSLPFVFSYSRVQVGNSARDRLALQRSSGWGDRFFFFFHRVPFLHSFLLTHPLLLQPLSSANPYIRFCVGCSLVVWLLRCCRGFVVSRLLARCCCRAPRPSSRQPFGVHQLSQFTHSSHGLRPP